MKHRRRYLSYLLRLWLEDGGERPLWRASLQSPQSDELQGFAGPDELFAFLREQIDMAAPAGGIEKGRRTPGTDSESEEE